MFFFLSSHKFKTLTFFGLLLMLNTFSYAQNSAEVVQTEPPPKPQSANDLPPKFRVGIYIGYAYKTAPAPIDVSVAMKKHLSKLSHNLNYGADFSYYFKTSFQLLSTNLGVGIKYNGLQTNVLSENIPVMRSNGSVVISSLSEKYRIDYVGVFLGIRSFLGSNKHMAFAHIGAGYIKYGNNTKIANEQVKISGNSVAFSADIGYDFFVTKNFAIGLQASLTLGTVNYRVDNLDFSDGKENVAHVDISLGFRFYK
jgi:hypothetical protein